MGEWRSRKREHMGKGKPFIFSSFAFLLLPRTHSQSFSFSPLSFHRNVILMFLLPHSSPAGCQIILLLPQQLQGQYPEHRPRAKPGAQLPQLHPERVQEGQGENNPLTALSNKYFIGLYTVCVLGCSLRDRECTAVKIWHMAVINRGMREILYVRESHSVPA